MRTGIILTVFLLFFSYSHAQLQSPDEFLGYELGTRFTPHYRIVSYFDHAAATMPGIMKLVRYGKTNEGRDLLLAIVASPENFPKLEEIRKNNLRLTGMLNDQPGDAQAPAIVWLSYNVHGNEASSSEVSMKCLYALLNPGNVQTKEWLKNTVVIIDPCLNPDGRDRYVNWFNQVTGSSPDASPETREHSEPWPGGRTNHYNFDLNRDWAWQTQVETRQRMKQYNDWMPQIHCDFHEQYPNNPYYFAPAAEPQHEVITPWQREFQTTIGKNHARYFDANGWLYFTRETFDLFYPSYGDTYPMFNGAIGMTYEQAGHSPGGLAYIKPDGDTLTLKDRIAHHFTTSMSTIEVASNYAQRVVTEFRKFFDDARTKGIGEYKTYIVTTDDASRLDALKALLDNNRIQYGPYSRTGMKGYNYFSGKEETINTGTYTIAINSLQPKSALVKVLFEPRSKLSDSLTYDITAWSLPYVYGLQSYACRENIPVTPVNTLHAVGKVTVSSYGYLVSYHSFSDVQLLAALLQRGIRVRYAEKEFSFNNRHYDKGSLIILRSGNENFFTQVPDILFKYHAVAEGVESGFMQTGFDFGSEKVHSLHKPRVAMLTGNTVSAGEAGEIWFLFDKLLNYPISLINANEISGINWKNTDVLIIPDGNYKFLTEKEGSADLKNWVRQGGKIIALENGAVQMAAGDWGFKLKKNEDDEKKEDSSRRNPYNYIRRYENREREGVLNNVPGAIYKMELDNSHPLGFGYTGPYFMLKQNDNLYEFLKDGWNVGVIKKEQQVAGFVGSRAREKIKDGTAVGVVPIGNGTIVFFADDPVFRCFWENGKMMLGNAVFLVGQ